jgi:hypothetical protein
MHAISGNGRHIKTGRSEKVSGENVRKESRIVGTMSVMGRSVGAVVRLGKRRGSMPVSRNLAEQTG